MDGNEKRKDPEGGAGSSSHPVIHSLDSNDNQQNSESQFSPACVSDVNALIASNSHGNEKLPADFLPNLHQLSPSWFDSVFDDICEEQPQNDAIENPPRISEQSRVGLTAEERKKHDRISLRKKKRSPRLEKKRRWRDKQKRKIRILNQAHELQTVATDSNGNQISSHNNNPSLQNVQAPVVLNGQRVQVEQTEQTSVDAPAASNNGINHYQNQPRFNNIHQEAQQNQSQAQSSAIPRDHMGLSSVEVEEIENMSSDDDDSSDCIDVMVGNTARALHNEKNLFCSKIPKGSRDIMVRKKICKNKKWINPIQHVYDCLNESCSIITIHDQFNFEIVFVGPKNKIFREIQKRVKRIYKLKTYKKCIAKIRNHLNSIFIGRVKSKKFIYLNENLKNSKNDNCHYLKFVVSLKSTDSKLFNTDNFNLQDLSDKLEKQYDDENEKRAKKAGHTTAKRKIEDERTEHTKTKKKLEEALERIEKVEQRNIFLEKRIRQLSRSSGGTPPPPPRDHL